MGIVAMALAGRKRGFVTLIVVQTELARLLIMTIDVKITLQRQDQSPVLLKCGLMGSI